MSSDVGGPLDLEVGSHFPIYDFCGLVSSFSSLAPVACLRGSPAGQVGTSAEGGNPPYPVLTYKGDGDHFALCMGRSEYYDFDITVLIYKPDRSSSDKHGDYQFGTCYPVTVYLAAQ